MIVNSETNRFVTQRQNPKMALIVPTFEDDNLVLNAPDASEIKISIGANRRTSPLLDVSIWNDNCTGIDEGKKTLRKGYFRGLTIKPQVTKFLIGFAKS